MTGPAFLLDLDGVVTDTAYYHFLAWRQLAQRLGLHFTEGDNERLKGVSRLRSFEIILEINGVCDMQQQRKEELIEEKNHIYQELIGQITPRDILPGVSSFLSGAKARGIPLAVASASKNAARVLRSLQIEGWFDYVADAGKIKRSKPDPEVFLTCAGALGVTPENCVGFEDAQAGIEALHAAGMFAVGIAVDVKTQPPDMTLDSTAQLNVPAVLQAFEKYKNGR